MTAPASPALDIANAMFGPEAIADPYRLYAQAQALARRQGSGDLLRVPEWNMALVFSHAAVSAVLRSPAAVSGVNFFPEGGDPAYPHAMRVMKPMMLFHHGASHTRLRSLAQAAFTPRVVAGSRELVQSRLNRLLQAAAGRPDFDAVADLAVPLPVGVITEMLGLAGEDEAKFRAWSGAVAELIGGSNVTPELMERVEQQAREMRSYFRGLADELRARPQPGLLSALAAVEDGGERLSSDELLANAVLLLVAGHETTTNLISGGLLELSNQPDAWAALVERPELAGNITEELLRLTSPVQNAVGRGLSQDVQIGGQTLKAGSIAGLILAAANRDPAVFPDPGRLDPQRPNSTRHLAFASGPHYCLGASLARLEGEVVFRTLAERYPRLKIPEQDVQFRPNVVLRGPLALRAALA